MDQQRIEYFRDLLTQRLDNLLKNADDVLSEMVAQHSDEIEYIDKASNFANQTMKLKIKSRESRLIDKIRNALDRIDDQTFGTCDTCGEEISEKRLEARPVTTKCIDCKEEEEQQEKLKN